LKAPTVLAVTSYFKGQRFLQRAHARGAKVFLLTVEKCLHKDWPRESLDDVFAIPDQHTLRDVVHTVSYLARSHRFDRVVALDDFDVEVAAHLREHLRLDGVGETLARYFRDKLAMRVGAERAGVPIPEYVALFNDEEVRAFTARVPAPWMLKPRSQASATGIKKMRSEAELWAALEAMGDDRAFHLLERYVPGDVFHVDSVMSGGLVRLSEAHQCGTPPFDVAHAGGIFSSHTIERGTELDRALKALNATVLTRFGLVRGTAHVEFIRCRETGTIYLLECAARVGGAHIADMIEASTGLNPWSEWADVEIDGDAYVLPTPRAEYGGLVVCLAREASPDTSAFSDPEIVYRSPEANHVGLVVRSPDPARARSLVSSYEERLRRDVLAVMPAISKPAH
jgi:hypothetical protein